MPCIKGIPGQSVVGAGLSRLYGEFVQPLRFVFSRARSGGNNLQPQGFV